MSIETRVTQLGIVFGCWQIREELRSGSSAALFRLEQVDNPGECCAMKIVNLIQQAGNLAELSEEDFTAYTELRRQRRKAAEQQLTGREDCLDFTFLDWEDDEGYGRDLLIRLALPEESLEDILTEMPAEPEAELPEKTVPEKEEPQKPSGEKVLIAVLSVLLAIAIVFVGFIFTKIILELKHQAELLAAPPAATAAAVVEMPTEEPTAEATEAPTEAAVVLDPTKVVDLSIGQCHVAAVYEDGSVDVVYLNQTIRKKYPAWDVWDASGVAEWTDIVQVSVSTHHMAGLRSDGTVVALGGNSYGECDVSEWTDIVAIETGIHTTVGLKADGTLVSAGSTIKIGNISYIEDAVAIDMGSGCLEYLQSDGSWKRRLADGSELNMGTYPGMVAIHSNETDSVGVLEDGTIVIGRTTRLNKAKLSEWTDIVDVYGSASCMLGLKSDGTVCAFGTDNVNFQQNVAHWTGVEKLVGPSVAIKKDGSIVLAGTGVVQSFDIGPLNKAPSVTEGEPGRIARSSTVNVRAYPGINCDIVNKLPMDTTVIVLEQKTTYDGKVWGRTMYGWISMEYIELD